jgi:hypothetical protein
MTEIQGGSIPVRASPKVKTPSKAEQIQAMHSD